MRAVVVWLRSLSIRHKVALGVAISVALVTLGFGLLITFVLHEVLDAAKEARLSHARIVASQLDTLAGRPSDEPAYGPELLSQLSGSARVSITVIDEKGSILTTSGDDEAPGIDPHFHLLVDLIRERRAGVRIHQVPGVNHIVAFSPLESTAGGAVIVEEVDAWSLSFSSRLLALLPFFGIGVLVVTSLSAWLYAHYTVRPLVQLEHAAASIASGHLDRPVTVARRDEIGRLAQSFDTMRQEMKAANDARLWWERQLEQRARERTLEVQRLVGRVINAQEEERRRLAQELHDDTAQAIAALLMRMEALRDSLPLDQEQIRRHIEPTIAQGTRALEDLRRVILGLRPGVLDDLGLVAALRSYAGAVLVPSGASVDFSVQGEERRLRPAAEVALFRILQEAMNNTARNAKAQNATVRLGFQDTLLVATVEDDGQGFDLAQAQERGSGLGLAGMQERADIVGARLEVTSVPGKGTEVKVELRLGEEPGAKSTGGTGG